MVPASKEIMSSSSITVLLVSAVYVLLIQVLKTWPIVITVHDTEV